MPVVNTPTRSGGVHIDDNGIPSIFSSVSVAVAGDPLKDITIMEHVTFVMKGGAVIKDEVHPRADH